MIGYAPIAATTGPPTPDFQIGTLHFPVSEYATNPVLQPFRDEFRRQCGTKRGTAAATCLTALMSARFPNGAPTDEFVSAHFDPVGHLRRHLAGEPGHCLTRSAILASHLLAVGLPARIVQVLPPGGSGHTLAEVWDEHYGWVLADPTYGRLVGTKDGPASAARLLGTPQAATWYGMSNDATPTGHQGGLPKAFMANAFRGQLVYPEPWLFLRVGDRSAPWPFRGRFVLVGPRKFRLGAAQSLLRAASVAFGLGALLSAGLAVLGLLQTDPRSLGARPKVHDRASPELAPTPRVVEH